MASQRDVKNKIASVKNIQKITRAMEMVAAARLRRAEQRIAALRPYADALRRMTRQAAQAAGAEAARLPLLRAHAAEEKVGLLLVTGDRGLAGGFNSQIIRAGVRISGELDEEGLKSEWYATGRRGGSSPTFPGDRGLAGGFNSQIIRAGVRISGELDEEGLKSEWYATGRRGVSSLTFRGYELSGSYTGFADRPAYADARTIADDLIQAYIDGRVDRVEMVYNSYISPLTQKVTHERLLPISHATIAGEEADAGESAGRQDRSKIVQRALVDYEPDPEEILKRLVPDYIEISLYRALVESAVGFFGAQMTAMRSASENAGEIITDLTLQMNRARQAEITQEIMEVVAGAEGLS